MDKIVLAVAPVGPWGPGDDNPLTPADLAREMRMCADAGASVVHLHSRAVTGELTSDTSIFDETVEGIKAGSDIIVEASTGGLSELSIEERGFTLKNPHAEAGSLNLGSLNFGDRVYQNTPPAVLQWIDSLTERKIKPSLEIFDTGNVVFARHLIDSGILRPQYNYSFIFNVRWGMPYSSGLLKVLKGLLPESAVFGGIFVENSSFAPHLECAELGASFLRVGFEDSRLLNGTNAKTNADLVDGLVSALRKHNIDVASPSEARAILDIRRRRHEAGGNL